MHFAKRSRAGSGMSLYGPPGFTYRTYRNRVIWIYEKLLTLFLRYIGLDMTPEKKRKTAKILSLVVIIAGVMVIIGWIFDIGILKSISPAWVSMKFDTAIAFVLSGITLYFIVRAMEGEFDKAQVVISVTSMALILLMGLLFFSAVLHIRTGADELFIKETIVSEKSIAPGVTSLLTMFNFLLTGVGGVLTILNPGKSRLKLKIIGLFVVAVGATAIFGYIIDVPLLYSYIEGVNSAIAFNTAALFILLGTGLLCL